MSVPAFVTLQGQQNALQKSRPIATLASRDTVRDSSYVAIILCIIRFCESGGAFADPC